jgi:hypothetical protein
LLIVRLETHLYASSTRGATSLNDTYWTEAVHYLEHCCNYSHRLDLDDLAVYTTYFTAFQKRLQQDREAVGLELCQLRDTSTFPLFWTYTWTEWIFYLSLIVVCFTLLVASSVSCIRVYVWYVRADTPQARLAVGHAMVYERNHWFAMYPPLSKIRTETNTERLARWRNGASSKR